MVGERLEFCRLAINMYPLEREGVCSPQDWDFNFSRYLVKELLLTGEPNKPQFGSNTLGSFISRF